jgi:predicted mannosyl-3-phosphoglycerate phosphatase (HAD superfamily)
LKYYANLSVAEISEITKLEPESSQKAKTRDFSETIFNADITSDEYAQFERAVNSKGFQCIPGSKYITISGKDTDKGRAVRILINIFKQKYGEVISFGAGDSLNDLPMLNVVDFPYLVQKPDKSWADIHLNKLTKVAAIGPEGWNIMAEEILVY